MPVLANLLNTDLSQGFTVTQVAQKHGWTESMVWSLALEEKDDLKKFKELGWGLRAWDQELSWPVSSKGKADLVIFDPPYFDKKADGYGEKRPRPAKKRISIIS
ncbi:MAG: hypothetical protein GY710_25845 [Desulfobacteraceae bacterium]|nr:hypothetical protein [Desulfobacteraceae bacterium]